MNGGDEMRNGDNGSAVRILPPDGSAPIEDHPDQPQARPRWLTPVIAILLLAGVFGIVTRPSAPDPAVPTTEPAPIAAVDAALIDLRPVASADKVTDWVEVDFADIATVADLGRAGNSLIAVGSTPDGAELWVSGTGASWREAGRVELPDNVKSEIEHLVSSNGDLIAIGAVGDGIGWWLADYVSTWYYQGLITPNAPNGIAHVAAGPSILALAHTENRTEGWLSPDGTTWESLGHVSDLDGLLVTNLIATDEWFFVVGSDDCSNPDCAGFIYRSRNGRSWESVHEGPNIIDITATADGFLATGIDSSGGIRISVWGSTDGTDWREIATADTSLAAAHVTVRLESARAGTNPWAELWVDDDLWDVTEGTVIETKVGSLEITAVRDGSITWADGVNFKPLRVGEIITLTAHSIPTSMAAEGPRVVITGTVNGSGEPRPAVWVSDDHGSSWVKIDLPGPNGSALRAVTTGRNLVVLGDTRDGPTIWRGAWNTAIATASAEARLASYVEALNQRNVLRLIELLPPIDAGPAQPSFMIPSLGQSIQDWWDEETGSLVPERVADTVDYLAATGTSIELGDCTSGATFGVADRVNLRCGITVDSSLLSLAGIEGGEGSITALVRNNVLSTVRVEDDPSINLWRILSSHLVDAEDTATPTGDDVSRLEFNAATAPEHAALADTVLSALLSPGVTTTVETAFGTMEWSWLTEPPLDADYLGSLTWTELGFFVGGYSQAVTASPNFGLWHSADGLDWVEVPLPDTLESMWDLQPYAGGLIGQGFAEDSPLIVFYDGSDWTLVAPPVTDAETYAGVWLAVSGDTIYGMLASSDPTRFSVTDAFLMGPDLSPRSASLPPIDSWDGFDFSLTGSDGGFAVAAMDFADMSQMTIWFSPNGRSWTRLSDSQSLGEARYLHQVQHHLSQYFVIAEAAEFVCSEQSGGGICTYVNNLWRSPDGTTWDRVVTDTGQSVSSYSIGSGTLGMVAIGQEAFDGGDPRSIYFSTDGITWTTRGGPTLLVPDSAWWWIESPVVGDDTVLAVGSSYSEIDNSDTAFMIIGRVVDD